MRRFLFKIIFLFIAVILALLSLELSVRAFLPMPENLAKLQSSTLFLLENKPHANFVFRALDGDTAQISINSFGFRDGEFSRQKEPGVFRIAVLGDSQEEALQVELFDTWQKVMARKLSQELGAMPAGRQVKVESYNFGVSGYGTDQQWLTLREKVWQFSPDMVILSFSPNDVGDVYKNRLVRIEDEKIRVMSQKERVGGNWLGRLVRETYLYHLVVRAASGNDLAKRVISKIRTKILGFAPEERFFLSNAQLVEGPFEVVASQKNPPKEVFLGWELVRALVGDMKRQAEEHGAKFLVTVNIPRAQVLPSDWELLRDLYKLDPETSSPYEINEVMGQITSDLGIDFYDPRLAAVEWKEKYGDLHLEKDGHFNKNGHEFMGTKVGEYILEKRLID